MRPCLNRGRQAGHNAAMQADDAISEQCLTALRDMVAPLTLRADHVDVRMGQLERSVGALHERVAGLDQRTAHVEHALVRLDAKIDDGLSRVEARLGGQIGKLDERLCGELRRLESRSDHALATLDAKLSGQILALDDKLCGQIAKLDDKFCGQIAALSVQSAALDDKLCGQIAKLGLGLSSLAESMVELRTAALLRSDVLERHFVSRGDLQEQLHRQTQRLIGVLIGWSSVLVALVWTVARLMH